MGDSRVNRPGRPTREGMKKAYVIKKRTQNLWQYTPQKARGMEKGRNRVYPTEKGGKTERILNAFAPRDFSEHEHSGSGSVRRSFSFPKPPFLNE